LTVVVLYVVGGLWFPQVVVYPLFGRVGPDEYVAYHRFYSSRIPLPIIVTAYQLPRVRRACHFRAPFDVIQ
jgi:hypothetical protein